jgi:hypothetical protein
MKITRGKQQRPRRVMLYGTHGIGKSSWAAQSPDVLFLNLEDGLADIDCAKTERITKWDQFYDAIVWLAQQKHDFRAVAIDTVDWLETLIHKEVAKQAGKNSIADIGYGNGYKQANAYWEKMITGLNWLRMEHGMTIILLAHSEIKKHQDPLLDSYDRYQPALHEQASATLQEWCDEVFFASYRVYTRKEDQGFNKERTIASGASERYLRCVETPAALAKNRLNMPGEIEFSWAAYSQHITGVSTEVKG